ncbi:hypothetical protein [Marixanthomonas ophiurae]|uniref:Uncharacterized protein n=1 Tax=Marixanthomonas ophiurae TaxID=387659 RepID=A0A3E1QCA8_9FLAO|nr:hypothetical protein [Marixanthomonas ophiurae]RFN59736.1 hypothetical protein DZ858_06695 [Marixanthomonas ophiurae]
MSSFYAFSQLEYDATLPSIQKCSENISINDSVANINFPDNVRNIGLLNNKMKVEKIELIPSPENKQLYGVEADHYFYGSRAVFGYKMILYSNEYLPWFSNNEKVYTTTEAYTLIVNKNSVVLGILKTFDDFYMKEEEYLKSFFCDNYILVVKSFDNSYDVNIQGKDSEVSYTYAVVELTEKGKLIVLSEEKGKKIGEKCLSQYDEFKGKF